MIEAPEQAATAAIHHAAGRGGPVITEFGEEAYCEAFPDIDAAIKADVLDAAATHFRSHGRKENRLTSPDYLRALSGGAPEFEFTSTVLNVDAAIVSPNGSLFLVGWIDDRGNPLRSVSAILGAQGSNTRAIGRCRRPDVDALLNAPPGYHFGFWLVMTLEQVGTALTLRARLTDGGYEQRVLSATTATDDSLRETVLGHFASLEYFGNRDIESFVNLDTGGGYAIARLSRSVSGAITAMAHAERYGPSRARFEGSLIICLFGKIEYFFLQAALFATGGAADYEFIYVSNSPELSEALQKEARIAELIYGLSVTVVTLPGNAGFSAANNAAARFARSQRLIFINPDVFPRDRNWAQTHGDIMAAFPREQTALFGAPLYYDDGSLMHGGMYFEVDQGLSIRPEGITTHGLVRVEHYGKGAPAWSDRYTLTRPVPAVTGALISADREWFEALGGFTEDYVFGHYEDADLCLKSLRQGVPVWLHDIRFWHLEGKGSTRRPPHEGGSLVNRWLFTRRWGETISRSLVGRTPSEPLLQVAPARAAMPVAQAAATPYDLPVAPPATRQQRARLQAARRPVRASTRHGDG